MSLFACGLFVEKSSSIDNSNIHKLKAPLPSIGVCIAIIKANNPLPVIYFLITSGTNVICSLMRLKLRCTASAFMTRLCMVNGRAVAQRLQQKKEAETHPSIAVVGALSFYLSQNILLRSQFSLTPARHTLALLIKAFFIPFLWNIIIIFVEKKLF